MRSHAEHGNEGASSRTAPRVDAGAKRVIAGRDHRSRLYEPVYSSSNRKYV